MNNKKSKKLDDKKIKTERYTVTLCHIFIFNFIKVSLAQNY